MLFGERIEGTRASNGNAARRDARRPVTSSLEVRGGVARASRRHLGVPVQLGVSTVEASRGNLEAAGSARRMHARTYRQKSTGLARVSGTRNGTVNVARADGPEDHGRQDIRRSPPERDGSERERECEEEEERARCDRVVPRYRPVSVLDVPCVPSLESPECVESARVERRARTERETRERPVARQTDPRHRRSAPRFGPHPRRFAALFSLLRIRGTRRAVRGENAAWRGAARCGAERSRAAWRPRWRWRWRWRWP